MPTQGMVVNTNPYPSQWMERVSGIFCGKATVLTNAFVPNKPGKQHALSMQEHGQVRSESLWVMYVFPVSVHVSKQAGKQLNGQGIPHRNCLNNCEKWLNSQQVASIQSNNLKIDLCHHLPLTLLHTCCMSCHFWSQIAGKWSYCFSKITHLAKAKEDPACWSLSHWVHASRVDGSYWNGFSSRFPILVNGECCHTFTL